MLKQLVVNAKCWPLMISHFLSALNDNFIRTVFLFFVTYKMTQTHTALLITAVLLYAAAYFTASLFAGQIADRYSRKKFLLVLRLIELGLMGLSILSITLNSSWIFVFIIAALGALGASLRVATYALVPQLTTPTKFNAANTWLKLLGVGSSVCASLLLVSVLKIDQVFDIICISGFVGAAVSYGVTRLLPDVPVADAQMVIQPPTKALPELIRLMKNRFDIWLYCIGMAWFWMFGATLAIFAADFGKEVLNVRWGTVMFISGVFALGYVLGALLYVRVSRKNNMGAYTSFVCALIALFLFDLVQAGNVVHALTYYARPLTVSHFLQMGVASWRVIIDVFVFGGLSAFYIIAFYTLLQLKTPLQILGRVLGFSSILNAVAVLCFFLIIYVAYLGGFGVRNIILTIAVLNLGVGVYLMRILPYETRKRLIRAVLKKLFKARISGLENLAKAGKKALIITNHTSYLDVLLISAFLDKKIVFAVNENLMNKRFAKFLTNLVILKPMDPSSPFAVKEMVQELNDNQLCMILIEGIIADGNTRMKLYEGPAMMAYKAKAPILPILIKGAKYTFFSRVRGTKAYFKAFPEITLEIKEPFYFNVPDNLSTRAYREITSSQLYDVISDMTFDSYDTDRTLFQATIHSYKTVSRFKKVLEDTARQPMNFFTFFLKTFVLSRLLGRALKNQERIGVMLPTSNTCLLTFMALQALGKIPAMINFSAGPKQALSTTQTIGLTTVLTARKVVALAKLEALIEKLTQEHIDVVYLEDLQKDLHIHDKLMGLYGALFPQRMYNKMMEDKVKSSQSTAVILFTSGSEGMPKAVFLTHQNLLSNIYQAVSRVDILPTDVLLNCLPMFHSFGLTIGGVLPLVLGIKVFLYPTPLHYRVIPEICASARTTVMFGTDTFLAGYAKCANPYDFNSLRLVVAGAEKLKTETRKIWLEKFGIRLLEGYGATECSPILAVNTFLHHRLGSVGRLLPRMGYNLKAIDGITEGAELWVNGPNVMQGYMRHTNPNWLEPPRDGWYDTGDVVEIDADGFVFIKGRCKRFAKIGGEMVSLPAIEHLINEKWSGFISGVVNIPDDRKGEKIALITTCADITKEKLIEAFKAAGITELGLPSKIIFTDNPPLLGTGKFNYVLAKEMALEQA